MNRTSASSLPDDVLRAIFSMSKVTFFLLDFSDPMIGDEAADYILAPVVSRPKVINP